MKKIHNKLNSYLMMNNKARLLLLAVILSLSTAYYVNAEEAYNDAAGSGNWASESQFLNAYTIIKGQNSNCEQSGSGANKYGDWTYGTNNSPIFRITDGEADDWLMAPEVFLYGGKNYTIELELTTTYEMQSGNNSTATLMAFYGPLNTIDGMITPPIGGITINKTDNDQYRLSFMPQRDGYFHIGFRSFSTSVDPADLIEINITSFALTVPDGEIEGLFPLPFYNDAEDWDMVSQFTNYWSTASDYEDAADQYGWWPTQFIGEYLGLWDVLSFLPGPPPENISDPNNLNGFISLWTNSDQNAYMRYSYLATPLLAIDRTRHARISFSFTGLDDMAIDYLTLILCKTTSNNINTLLSDPDVEMAFIQDFEVSGTEWTSFEWEINHSPFSDGPGYYCLLFEHFSDANSLVLILDSVKVDYLPFATVTATSGNNGTISPPLLKTAVGAIATFDVTPEPGYIIDQLIINGFPQTSFYATATQLSFTVPTAINTIHVTFKLRPSYNLPYICNFNNVQQYGEWSVFDLNNDNISWICFTGNQYVRMSNWSAPAVPQNDVLVTPPLNMLLGNTNAINVRYRYRVADASYSEKVKVVLTREDDVTSNTTTNALTIADHANITNDSWNVQSTVIMPSQLSGIGSADHLFLKFHCYSDGDMYYPYIDSVSITVIPNPTISAFATDGGTISPPGDMQIPYGSSITYTITIQPGYMIQNIFIDGNPISNPTTSYTFTNVTTDHTIEVQFQKLAVSITASIGYPLDGSGGTITPIGVISKEYGDDQTFNFPPATGWEVDRVYVNGTLTPTLDNTHTFYNITAETQTIEVFFKRETYTITVSSGPNGSISPSGSFLREFGESATFTIAPESEEFEINVLTVNGTAVPIARDATSYTLENISGNTSINITFRRITYSVTVSSSGLGSVSPTGFITVNRGADLEFVLTPINQFYHVASILLDGMEVPKTEYANNRFSMNNIQNAYTLEIFFEPITYKVITSSSGPGTISPAGTLTYFKGEDVYIVLRPSDPNKEPIALVINGEVIDYKDTVFRIESIDDDYEIHAIFDEKSYIITAIADGGGEMTPVGNVRVYIYQDQTFTFAPWQGFQIDYIRVNGKLIEDLDRPYTFRNVTANGTIQVYFKPEDPTAYTITSSATNGTISPTNGIAVSRGFSQAFTFEPDPGYELDVVRINGVTRTDIRGNSYTFNNVQSNSSIQVDYRIARYTLNVQTNCEYGRISPDGMLVRDFKTTEVFKFVPQPGYKVDQVFVNDIAVEIYGNMLPVYVTQNMTITATFVADGVPPVIVSSAGPGGTITPNGNTEVPFGSDQLYEFTPEDGFIVEKVEVDNAEVPYNETDNTYTFIYVTEDHTIHVTFVSAPTIENSTITDAENKFILYPNPTSSVINLQGDLNEIEVLEVLDLAGSKVLEFSNISNQIDISKFPNGTYTIRILRKDRKIENYSVIKIK
ncbi:MAG: T9SS type A sorting domain-containing protein [Bacteroidetes bacterium]|nr:T9SS type A sorting domain-containing protein [Bacteroidota bacterium]